MSRGAVQIRAAEILSVRRVGEYTEFTVVAPEIAAGFKPGHFVAVAVGGERSSMILRRAFALSGAVARDEFAGTIQFVVAEHGPGTRWLVQRRTGETLDVVGPLGTPFPIPSGPSRAVLVGGGYGTAPLIPLARALLDNGSPLEFIVGAATAGRLYGELAAKRMVGQLTVTTDDGSAGEKGMVTDVLPEAIERVNAEVVYACGPMAMLQAVGAIAAQRAIRAQVAVEEAMACGIGVCMTCVLPVRGSDGRSRFVRSCVDGPVFDARTVRWSDVGKLPRDLVGADAMGGGH
ncbi:MAG TPA: dihydroorotate dehydrogenase electron transfer subunit [Jatrophihabitans sp.]|nr:dihydroorotate dehydrogenase electron transfer subunit [Jatrophihabitans sp.]